jgi:hypothetical protein
VVWCQNRHGGTRQVEEAGRATVQGLARAREGSKATVERGSRSGAVDLPEPFCESYRAPVSPQSPCGLSRNSRSANWLLAAVGRIQLSSQNSTGAASGSTFGLPLGGVAAGWALDGGAARRAAVKCSLAWPVEFTEPGISRPALPDDYFPLRLDSRPLALKSRGRRRFCEVRLCCPPVQWCGVAGRACPACLLFLIQTRYPSRSDRQSDGQGKSRGSGGSRQAQRVTGQYRQDGTGQDYHIRMCSLDGGRPGLPAVARGCQRLPEVTDAGKDAMVERNGQRRHAPTARIPPGQCCTGTNHRHGPRAVPRSRAAGRRGPGNI